MHVGLQRVLGQLRSSEGYPTSVKENQEALQSEDSSLFRVYILAARSNIDFNMAAIPDDAFPDLDVIEFDTVRMRAFYDFAYEHARSGYEWAKIPPRLEPSEVIEPLPDL